MRVLAATLGLGAALVLAGCGGVGSVATKGDVTNGKTLFTKGENGKPPCASCHTLADAGATGKVGPDLDTTFAFARVAANKGDRFCSDTIANVVLDQIRFPSGNNLEPQYVMPANLVTGKHAVDVARYVASVAGIPPGKKPDKEPAACS